MTEEESEQLIIAGLKKKWPDSLAFVTFVPFEMLFQAGVVWPKTEEFVVAQVSEIIGHEEETVNFIINAEKENGRGKLGEQHD